MRDAGSPSRFTGDAVHRIREPASTERLHQARVFGHRSRHTERRGPNEHRAPSTEHRAHRTEGPSTPHSASCTQPAAPSTPVADRPGCAGWRESGGEASNPVDRRLLGGDAGAAILGQPQCTWGCRRRRVSERGARRHRCRASRSLVHAEPDDDRGVGAKTTRRGRGRATGFAGAAVNRLHRGCGARQRGAAHGSARGAGRRVAVRFDRPHRLYRPDGASPRARSADRR